MPTNIGGPSNPVFVTNDNQDRPITGGPAQPVYITNLSGSSSGTVPDASTTERGIIEIATTAEAQAGTDTERAVVPSGLPFRLLGPYGSLKGPNFTQGNPGNYAIDIQTARSDANKIASGTNAIGIGRDCNVNGFNGIAIGSGADAPAVSAISIGANSQALYNNSISFGVNSTALNTATIAIGLGATASGLRSIALGPVSNAVADSIKMGVATNSYLHLTTFTPAVGVGVASTHTLTVNISGTVYRVLLATP